MLTSPSPSVRRAAWPRPITLVVLDVSIFTPSSVTLAVASSSAMTLITLSVDVLLSLCLMTGAASASVVVPCDTVWPFSVALMMISPSSINHSPASAETGRGDCQQQGEGEREESSFHAVSSCVCIPYPAGRRTGIAPGGDLPVQWGTPLQISLHANCLALVPSISDIRPNSKPFLKNRGIIFSRRPAAKLPQNFLPSRACAGGEDGV